MKDKRKIAVIAVLAIAVLGIGAFQFANMSGQPAPQAKVEEKPKTEPPTEEAENPPAEMVADLYRVGMNVRDPFQEGQLPLQEGATPPPTVSPTRITAPVRRPSANRMPRPLAGNFNPLPPTAGGISLQPGSPIRNPEEFSYSVTGVITGAKPAAVFVDGSGNQRLVTVGGSLDGDSQLVSVEKGKVTVRHKGKTQTLNVGGTPNVK